MFFGVVVRAIGVTSEVKEITLLSCVKELIVIEVIVSTVLLTIVILSEPPAWDKVGTDVNVIAALTIPAKSINDKTLAKSNVNFLFVILCCNSAVTMVYKHFYFLE
jgi:hypothetical protein